MDKKTVVEYEIVTSGATFEVEPDTLNSTAGSSAAEVVADMKDAHLSKIKLIDNWDLLYDEDITIRVEVREYEDGELVESSRAEW